MLSRYSGAQPHRDVELAVGLELRGCHRAAERRLDDGVDVAGIEAVARGLVAIDRDIEVGLAEHPENAEIGDAPDLIHLVHDLVGDLLELGEVRTDDLDRIGAFDARQALPRCCPGCIARS